MVSVCRLATRASRSYLLDRLIVHKTCCIFWDVKLALLNMLAKLPSRPSARGLVQVLIAIGAIEGSVATYIVGEESLMTLVTNA